MASYSRAIMTMADEKIPKIEPRNPRKEKRNSMGFALIPYKKLNL